jgi:hypothetical protein
MRNFIYSITAVTCLMPAALLAAPPEPAELEQFVLKARTFRQTQRTVMELFQSASNDRIEELKGHSHDQIALHAAWEQVRRTIRNVPNPGTADGEGEYPDPPKIDERALQRFLGFLEGRFQLSLPEWWATRLAGAYAHVGDISYLHFISDPEQLTSENDMESDKVPYSKTESGLYAAEGTSVKKLPTGDFNVQIGELSCDIPGHFFGDAEEFDYPIQVPYLTATMSAERCVFAFRTGGTFSGRFRIHCLDRKSSALLWSAKGLQHVTGGGSGRGHYHWVAMRQRGDRLYVFGMLGYLVSIDTYSMKDGTKLTSFDTHY